MKTKGTPAAVEAGNRKSDDGFSEVMAYAMMNALSMVIVTDAETIIKYVNKKFTKVTGYSAEEALGQPASILESGKTPKRTHASLWRHLNKGEGWSGELRNRTKSGRLFWELASISPVVGADGRVHHYLKISVDITGRKRLEARLQRSHDELRIREARLQAVCQELEQAAQELDKSRLHMQRLAQRDALTGLLNRRGFKDALKRVQAQAERLGNRIGFLVIDIDRFKHLNDEYGHAFGDRVLKMLAKQLKGCLRDTDLICRFGGDEVVVVLPAADAEMTQHAAQRILEAVRRAKCRAGKELIPFSVSIGAASEAPDSGLTPEQVIAQADQALYRVKRSGQHGTAAFWPVEDERILSATTKILSRPCSVALGMLVVMLSTHDRATGAHSRRVAKITSVLAEEMGLSTEQVEAVRQAALLHDIGKIAIPSEILKSPEPLTAHEWQLMQRHPQTGYDILNRHPDFASIAEIVYSHHEWHDGAGYPRGLKGEDICLGARISAVADVYDTIRAGRPYAAARSAAETLAEIQRCSGSQFDPTVVDALVRCQAEIETGSGKK